jgi:hypothetical protein
MRTTTGRREWSTIGTVGFEVYRDGNVVRLVANDAELPDGLQRWVLENEEDWCELVIRFRSTGYSEPASMYGGPQNVGWPAEYDDERTLVDVQLVIDRPSNRTTVFVEEDLAADLFAELLEKIQDADVDREYEFYE